MDVTEFSKFLLNGPQTKSADPVFPVEILIFLNTSFENYKITFQVNGGVTSSLFSILTGVWFLKLPAKLLPLCDEH